MRVEVYMSADEDKFSVNSWWAKSPEFVINALQRQLEAASAVWPELKSYAIGTTRPPETVDESASVTGTKP